MTARIERCSGRTIARKDTANNDPEAKLTPNENSSSHGINRWMVTRREEMAPMGDLTKRYKPDGTKRRPVSNTKPGCLKIEEGEQQLNTNATCTYLGQDITIASTHNKDALRFGSGHHSNVGHHFVVAVGISLGKLDNAI